MVKSYSVWIFIKVNTMYPILNSTTTLQADPSQKVRGIIGFGDNRISQAMQPQLTNEELPQLATKEDFYEFGNKVVYFMLPPRLLFLRSLLFGKSVIFDLILAHLNLCHAEKIKMPCPLIIFSQSNYMIQVVSTYSHT